MHTVAALALDKVVPFDVSTPVEVFTRTRLPDGRPAYTDADTIILPGCADPTAPVPDEVLDPLRQAAANGTRIASICDVCPGRLPRRGVAPRGAGPYRRCAASARWSAHRAGARCRCPHSVTWAQCLRQARPDFLVTAVPFS